MADQTYTSYTGDLPDPRKNTRKKAGAYFPSTFTDPAIKRGKDYCLQTTEAVYYRSWSAWNSPFGNLDRNRAIDTKAFSNGQFDVQAFMGGKPPENDDTQNPILKNLDFDPVTEQPKMRDIVVGYMEELKFTITATTINPAGLTEKENIKLNELAAINLQPMAQKLQQQAGTQIMPPQKFPFKTAQELNTYFELGGFKLIAELQIEVGNKTVQNDSDWDMIKKNISEDAFDSARIAVDIELDGNNKFKYIYVDTINCGIEDYRGHYLAQPSRIWYTTVMTVQQIILDAAKCGTPFTPEQARELAMKYENKYNNPSWSAAEGVARQYVNTDTTLGFFWYQWKVPVMKCYWEELDVYKTSTVTKAGKTIKTPTGYDDQSKVYYDNSKPGRPPEERKKDVKEIYVHNYYQSKWIPGTEYIYDYGPVPFQARDPYDIRRALCPLKYYRIGLQATGERVKGLVKREYMAWLKLDQEVANAKPFGWKINVAALENITIGQGKTLTVEHQIEVFNNTGNLIYRDEALADEYGRTKGKDPLIPIEQKGVLDAMQRWMALINYYKSRIVDVTGINEFMDATNPNSNTPATVAEAAIQGSKNSMSQISSAIRAMQRYLAIDVSQRIQLMVAKKGSYDITYSDSMGPGLLQSASIGKEVLGYTYGISVEALPNEKERTKMKDAIYQAFASMASPDQGGLWVDSMLMFNEMVDGGTPMKIVRLLMQAKQKEALDYLQAQKTQLMQAQSQAQAQQAQQQQQGALQQEQQMSNIRMNEQAQLTEEINKRNANLINLKTIGKIATDSHKSELKGEEDQRDLWSDAA